MINRAEIRRYLREELENMPIDKLEKLQDDLFWQREKVLTIIKIKNDRN